MVTHKADLEVVIAAAAMVDLEIMADLEETKVADMDTTTVMVLETMADQMEAVVTEEEIMEAIITADTDTVMVITDTNLVHIN